MPAPKTFKTGVDLAPGTREKLHALLNQQLAEPEAIDSLPCVDALAARFSGLAATTRAAIDTSAEAGDMDTADLFTEVSRGLDKAL